jgi:hypothetical protein
MALFTRIVRQVHRNGGRRVVVFERPQTRLPPHYKHLTVLCHNLAAHALPVQTQFAGFRQEGQPLAIYVCPCNRCGCQQAWARHRKSGKPFRLY